MPLDGAHRRQPLGQLQDRHRLLGLHRGTGGRLSARGAVEPRLAPTGPVGRGGAIGMSHLRGVPVSPEPSARAVLAHPHTVVSPDRRCVRARCPAARWCPCRARSGRRRALGGQVGHELVSHARSGGPRSSRSTASWTTAFR